MALFFNMAMENCILFGQAGQRLIQVFYQTQHVLAYRKFKKKLFFSISSKPLYSGNV